MNTQKIRSAFFALIATAVATFGLAACDTGTSPGETNVERSDHVDEGSIVGDNDENRVEAERDTMEQPYERAEEGSAVHAGDGTGEGTERDDVKKEDQ